MATLNTAISFARAQTQSDSNGLTDTNALIFANEALLDSHRKFIASGIDASQLQESYMDATVPSAGNGSTFTYPDDMFFLKAIEINFAGGGATNYLKANQIDVANLPAGESFSWYRTNASVTNPLFDDRGDWFEIFPTFTSGMNLTQAVRIFYFLEPTEYTSLADTIAYPQSLDYRCLGWRIASNYLYSLGKIDEGDKFNMKYEERMTQLIATLGRGVQQPLQATPIQLSGWSF